MNSHLQVTSQVSKEQVDSQTHSLKIAKYHLTQEMNNHKHKKEPEDFLEQTTPTEYCVLLSEILIQDSLNKLYVNLKIISKSVIDYNL